MSSENINKVGNPIESLQVALRGLNLRSKAITSNISNLNTPGYKRKYISFEKTLEKVQDAKRTNDIVMKRTHDKHFGNDVYRVSNISLELDTDSDSVYRMDGNNVNLDKEMVDLSKTGLKFRAVSNMARKYYESIRGIARGG